VGKENQTVKLSLFDVAEVNNPKEVDKYQLDEHWTEVQNTHHAFLLDDKHGVFFIPGGKGGYIFSFNGGSLKLVKAVSDTGIKRAIYINDNLYLVGNNKITVLDEKSWQVIKTFSL